MDKLRGHSRDRTTCAQRILFAYCCIKYADSTSLEMATQLQRTRGTLSRQLNHFSNCPEEYDFANGIIQKIENELKHTMNSQTVVQSA